jgi:hypothetical protein
MPRRKVARCSEAVTPADSMNAGSELVPQECQQLYSELVLLTDAFCNERLNGEYLELCRHMAELVCQPESPAVRGKPASWASGIVSAVGWVNFLTDPSQEPHVRAEEIAKWFGVSMATMQSKAMAIREGLDLIRFDPDFTLPSRMENNPLVWMFEVNGLILDIRHAPRDVQEAAFEAGVIPFIPADRGAGEPANVLSIGPGPVPAKRTPAKAVAKQAVGYQIKVTLDNSEPSIWRRLHVPDCTLEELHDVIQTAMGWQDCHLHEFRAGDERFVMAGTDEFDVPDDNAREESEVLLSELVAARRKKLSYWYDFGDDWRHTIKIEKTLRAAPEGDRPTCVEGAGACPPEDIGGLWGYEEFLEALGDPKHERHEELVDWYGGEFDPARFDVDEVNELLGR